MTESDPFIKITMKPGGASVETNVPMDVFHCLFLKGLLSDVASSMKPQQSSAPGILLARGGIPANGSR